MADQIDNRESVSGSNIPPEDTAAVIGALNRPDPNGVRGNMPMPGTAAAPAAAEGALPPAMSFGKLCETNPDYDAEYWHQLRALYEGGKRLLRDQPLMSKLFPRHRDETQKVYIERKKCAFYVPYAGEIGEHLIAQLFTEPLRMGMGDETDGEEGETPDWGDAFSADVSPPGGKKISLQQLVRAQIRNALICRSTWTLVDFPASGSEQYSSLRDQEQGGGLDAYALEMDPAAVTDWEEDEAGELLWCVLSQIDRRRKSISDSRKIITRTWTVYTRDGWGRYRVAYPESKPPAEDTMIRLVDEGTHSFGRVPIIRLDVPDGLWLMDKLEGLARAHFNERSALCWAERQHALPELYEFLGPEVSAPAGVVGEAQEDPSRAVNQVRGQGFVQVRGKDDEAEFVAPPSDAFEQIRNSCNDLRDEMHRVTHQMALTIDNSPAALKRSAESKAHDKAATAVVLTALGELAREHAERILEMVSLGRKEPEATAKGWHAKGLDQYKETDTTAVVEEAVALAGVEIPSPTFQRLHKFNLAKTVLGEEATAADLEKIEAELEQNLSDEMFDPVAKEENELDRMEKEAEIMAKTKVPPKGGPPFKGK